MFRRNRFHRINIGTLPQSIKIELRQRLRKDYPHGKLPRINPSSKKPSFSNTETPFQRNDTKSWIRNMLVKPQHESLELTISREDPDSAYMDTEDGKLDVSAEDAVEVLSECIASPLSEAVNLSSSQKTQSLLQAAQNYHADENDITSHVEPEVLSGPNTIGESLHRRGMLPVYEITAMDALLQRQGVVFFAVSSSYPKFVRAALYAQLQKCADFQPVRGAQSDSAVFALTPASPVLESATKLRWLQRMVASGVLHMVNIGSVLLTSLLHFSNVELVFDLSLCAPGRFSKGSMPSTISTERIETGHMDMLTTGTHVCLCTPSKDSLNARRVESFMRQNGYVNYSLRSLSEHENSEDWDRSVFRETQRVIAIFSPSTMNFAHRPRWKLDFRLENSNRTNNSSRKDYQENFNSYEGIKYPVSSELKTFSENLKEALLAAVESLIKHLSQVYGSAVVHIYYQTCSLLREENESVLIDVTERAKERLNGMPLAGFSCEVSTADLLHECSYTALNLLEPYLKMSAELPGAYYVLPTETDTDGAFLGVMQIKYLYTREVQKTNESENRSEFTSPSISESFLQFFGCNDTAARSKSIKIVEEGDSVRAMPPSWTCTLRCKKDTLNSGITLLEKYKISVPGLQLASEHTVEQPIEYDAYFATSSMSCNRYLSSYWDLSEKNCGGRSHTDKVESDTHFARHSFFSFRHIRLACIQDVLLLLYLGHLSNPVLRHVKQFHKGWDACESAAILKNRSQAMGSEFNKPLHLLTTPHIVPGAVLITCPLPVPMTPNFAPSDKKSNIHIVANISYPTAEFCDSGALHLSAGNSNFELTLPEVGFLPVSSRNVELQGLTSNETQVSGNSVPEKAHSFEMSPLHEPSLMALRDAVCYWCKLAHVEYSLSNLLERFYPAEIEEHIRTKEKRLIERYETRSRVSESDVRNRLKEFRSCDAESWGKDDTFFEKMNQEGKTISTEYVVTSS